MDFTYITRNFEELGNTNKYLSYFCLGMFLVSIGIFMAMFGVSIWTWFKSPNIVVNLALSLLNMLIWYIFVLVFIHQSRIYKLEKKNADTLAQLAKHFEQANQQQLKEKQKETNKK